MEASPSLPRSGDADARHMRAALALARRGLGTTAPNPSVGAVIVDPSTDEVVARGWTQPGGRPHAETVALERAGTRARGATMYVTLEPCSHHGRTPPCTDAVIAAGIARVVLAIEDPDPRVAGRGSERLAAAGIAVARFVETEAADQIARGHILRVTERRPLVALKMAFAADGTVPAGTGRAPVWATGAAARAHGHLLRARSDAIVVGAGTVAADDPELTCRLPGAGHRSPVRVVLSAGAALPLDSKLVRSARRTPTLLFAAADAPPERLRDLAMAGVSVRTAALINGRLRLPAVAEQLAADGITRLLVEGGPLLWRAFGEARLVDEISLYWGRGVGQQSLRERLEVLARLADVVSPDGLDLAESRRLGADDLFVLRYHRPRSPSGRGSSG